MTTKDVLPRRNLPNDAEPWGRAIEGVVDSLGTDVEQLSQRVGNMGRGNAGALEALARQIETIQEQQALLLSLQTAVYAQFTTGHTGGTGFYAAPCAVAIVSPTGRIRITFGGALNGGDGYFVYSVTGATSGVIVNRATVQANPAQRVAVTGGASFSPSGFNTATVSVPPNEVLTVALEIYAGSSFTFFLGGSISVQVAP